MQKDQILSSLMSQKPFLKVIAGIENFKNESVRTVAQAAAGLSIAVDVAADKELVQWVKANTSLITFVSSLEPEELAQAVEWGADVLELGNFDPIYKRGLTISGQQVLDWTRSLQQLTQGKALLCITVPGQLPVAEQVDLALQLQAAGADLLQIENVREDLSHAVAIRQAVDLPLLLSAGLDSHNLPEAIQTGVEGIGVGAAIRAQQDLTGMQAKIAELQQCLAGVSVR